MFTGSEDQKRCSSSFAGSATPRPVLPRDIRARAFTLLEIMLAVIILGMMSLAIYRFVQANVTAMRVSSEGDAVEARYDGLRELLTQQFQSLPPGTVP